VDASPEGPLAAAAASLTTGDEPAVTAEEGRCEGLLLVMRPPRVWPVKQWVDDSLSRPSASLPGPLPPTITPSNLVVAIVLGVAAAADSPLACLLLLLLLKPAASPLARSSMAGPLLDTDDAATDATVAATATVAAAALVTVARLGASLPVLPMISSWSWWSATPGPVADMTAGDVAITRNRVTAVWHRCESVSEYVCVCVSVCVCECVCVARAYVCVCALSGCQSMMGVGTPANSRNTRDTQQLRFQEDDGVVSDESCSPPDTAGSATREQGIVMDTFGESRSEGSRSCG
jgi:hypothetical protein